jgi:hypothetical protein
VQASASQQLAESFGRTLAEAVARRLAELVPLASGLGSNGADLRLISAREAGVPPRTWRQAAITGHLETVKIGREYRARRCDVDKWLDGLRVRPPPSPEAPRLTTDDAIVKLLRSGRLRPIKGGRT